MNYEPPPVTPLRSDDVEQDPELAEMRKEFARLAPTDNVVSFKTRRPEAPPLEPRIMLASDFDSLPEENADDIVENLIPKRMATLLAGRGGNGKTYICQMLQTAASVGQNWLGQKVRRCRSFGLFSEDPSGKLKARQRNICRHYGVDCATLEDMASVMPNDDGNFTLFSCFRRFAEGTPRTLWAQIEQYCVDSGVELIILDNIQNIFEGDPFSDQHVNSFMRWFNSRARIINCAIILVTNPPKDRSSYFRGTQKWEDSARCTLSLNPPRDREGKDVDGEFVLRVEKNSYLPYNHPLKRCGIALEWGNDVLVPKHQSEPARLDTLGRIDLDCRILKAVAHGVNVLGWKFAADPQSPNYLPGKLAAQRRWQHIPYDELVASLDRLLTDRKLIKVAVKDTWLIRPPDGSSYLGE